MDYIDLNEENIETILKSLDFREEEIFKIRQDSEYYDRYILVREDANIGFVSVLEQPFKDPYFAITLDVCDLISYRGITSLDAFLDVLDDTFVHPQITRAPIGSLGNFQKRGFKQIEEKMEYEGSSRLIPVNLGLLRITKPEQISKVRPMKLEDLSDVSVMFYEEYQARFRLVRRMYETDPSSCFVYEEYGEIKGVVFAEKLCNKLHVHQIFVKASEREQGIGRTLLEYITNYAKESGYSPVTGNIRGNLRGYYFRLGIEVNESLEEEVYIVRFCVEN